MANVVDQAESTVEIGSRLVDPRRDEVRVDSVTLARLLEEVRNGNASELGSYNRQHNRHNR